ncbi:hypothetical protein [Bacillus thuringiensis]|uniref:Uncharacterized protein n=1 Tax=Bacillus thuringiensis TaxID=1428 RepID=A0A9W3VH04_BACTU|nr:hypothetical protein [Bacillus thuringiensis]AMR06412.1 hypothetical protein AXW78_29355 [Bacillus thuringiensis]AYF84986.1 hypothetical protein D7J84_28615 [Bacillus thuringiensis]AYF85058.1 hypothetical protein D7J84_28990 [Bacillus thuringiensis]PNK34938.1 hypothetical protein CBR55_27655 [Bacillus thuringiensis]
MEKRKKMQLICKNMPDDVYEILDEKSSKRNLTEYVVDLVQNQNKDQQLIRMLMEKLNNIESTLHEMKNGSIVVKPEAEKSKETKIDEPVLLEGTIVEAEIIEGGIDESDKEEMDF